MRNLQKIIILSIICLLTFASCKKKESEWKRLYGYTRNDIVGSYTFSNCAEAFQGLTQNDTVSCICKDAEITIDSISTDRVKIRLKCPDEDYDRQFLGKAPATSYDFQIFIQGETQHHSHTTFSDTYSIHKIQADIYHNEKGQIRLAGAGMAIRYLDSYKFIYDFDGHVVDTIITTKMLDNLDYFFDVVKVATAN